VAYGILRGTGEIFQRLIHRGVDFYEVDKGYTGARHYSGLYRISKNGMQAKYKKLDLPMERMLTQGLILQPWRKTAGSYVLLCPPTPSICDYYGIDRKEWIKEQEERFEATKVRNKTDDLPLIDDLLGASKVVAYNSSVAIYALMKGIPAEHTAEDSVLADWDGEDRESLFTFISHAQFTLDEIRSGLAWKTVTHLQ
jgi:hypothetical protein